MQPVKIFTSAEDGKLKKVIEYASGARVEIFTEIIDIFAWVFMWEAVDIFFLQCTMLNFKQKRYLRLYDSIIEYLPLKDCYGEKHGGCDE